MPVPTYSNETVIWREKERSRIRAIQMDNLRGLLGIKRMDNPKCPDKVVVWSNKGCGQKD